MLLCARLLCLLSLNLTLPTPASSSSSTSAAWSLSSNSRLDLCPVSVFFGSRFQDLKTLIQPSPYTGGIGRLQRWDSPIWASCHRSLLQSRRRNRNSQCTADPFETSGDKLQTRHLWRLLLTPIDFELYEKVFLGNCPSSYWEFQFQAFLSSHFCIFLDTLFLGILPPHLSFLFVLFSWSGSWLLYYLKYHFSPRSQEQCFSI